MDRDGSQVKSVEPRILKVSKKSFVFSIDLSPHLHYVFMMVRKRKKIAINIYRVDGSNVEPMIEIDASPNEIDSIAPALETCPDDFIKTHSTELVDVIKSAIDRWHYEAVRSYILKLLAGANQLNELSPPRGVSPTGGLETMEPETISILRSLISKRKLSTDQVVWRLSRFIGELPAELFEVIVSVATTLKIVNRLKGRVSERPVWLVVVAPPSSLKTTIMSLLYDSRYVFSMQNFTPASLLPAKQDVPPLIDAIHNRVFIIPTLSEETADRENARKVFAALESIYDGEYGRSTALGGQIKKYVDTVVVAGVTPAVWERVLPYIENIGSRWLVYRFNLDDREALKLFNEGLKELSKIYPALRQALSSYLDMVMDTITDSDFDSVYIPNEYRKDLDDLALLMAKLRVSWGREVWRDEESGKATEVLRVYHVEAPIRARAQLELFVKANVLIRRDSIEKTVGCPTVDEHAMRLAAKLAVSSTSNDMMELVLYLAERGTPHLTIRDLEVATGISRSQIHRLLTVLSHPRVGIIDPDTKEVLDPYRRVICKYLVRCNEGQ